MNSTGYATPEKIEYQYKREGFDKDWQSATKLNQTNYTNLDPGTYTFRVKGTNSDGIWSPHEAAIIVIISPPWWGTRWFQLLVAVLLLV